MNQALITKNNCSIEYEKNIIEQSIRHFCSPSTEVLAVYNFNDLRLHSTSEKIAFIDKEGNKVLSNVEHNFSKTAKVVIKDEYYCKECLTSVNFVAVAISHVDNAPKPSVYFGYLDYEEEHFTIMTKDHIIPKAEGGNNSMKNLQCLCYDCNQNKADKIGDDLNHNNDSFKYRIQPDDPRLNLRKRQRSYVKVDEEEYEIMKQKVRDFYNTRKNIKNSINRMPWYLKMFGLHRYIERKIRQHLLNRGYYNNDGNNNIKRDEDG